MTGIRKNLWEHLKDRVFRKAYREESIKNQVAFQIKAMREARGWSQGDLAQRSGKNQSAIARIEDPDYGKFSLQTLLEVAEAFDVWLSVQFTSFSVGLERSSNLSTAALNAISFESDAEGKSQTSTASTNITLRQEFSRMENAIKPMNQGKTGSSERLVQMIPLDPDKPRAGSHTLNLSAIGAQ